MGNTTGEPLNWEEPSKFNMGLATLQRIHNLLVLSTEIMLTPNPDYQRILKIEEEIWMEVRPYLRKNEDKKDPIDKKLKEVRENMNYNANYNQRKFINSNKRNLFVKGLKEFRMLLRDMLDEKGYLMPKTDDPRYAAYE